VELTVKITPRVAAPVARRLRLAASVRSRSMSAVVNDALDATLPSLEEIRMQLAAPAPGESGMLADIAASHPGLVTVITTRDGAAAAQVAEGGAGDGVR
jgi:plasmid stability protein